MASTNIHNICAVVVWYHPTEQEADRIRLYEHDVDCVIVVDNSENDNSRLLASFSNVIYLPQLSNTGIAAALNTGCREALKHKAEWVLTMDQDSRWDQHSVQQYIRETSQYDQLARTAVFSPFHDCDGHPEKHHRNGRFEPRQVVMCSGNLLRLSAWQEIKGFNESFFIDYVDDEMCCHVRQNGWLVVRANEILLTHSLGNGARTIGATKHVYVSHPAWRYYYIARNARRMQSLYPSMRKYYSKQLGKYLKRLLLYDWSDKKNKLHEFFRGWRDT
jgi:rhamnosyltransferase